MLQLRSALRKVTPSLSDKTDRHCHIRGGLAVNNAIALPFRKTKISYGGCRFPPEIIEHAIWLYYRFTLSFRDVEDLLAKRGIIVSYETIRRWANHFGPTVAADLRKRRPKPPCDLASGRGLI